MPAPRAAMSQPAGRLPPGRSLPVPRNSCWSVRAIWVASARFSGKMLTSARKAGGDVQGPDQAEDQVHRLLGADTMMLLVRGVRQEQHAVEVARLDGRALGRVDEPQRQHLGVRRWTPPAARSRRRRRRRSPRPCADLAARLAADRAAERRRRRAADLPPSAAADLAAELAVGRRTAPICAAGLAAGRRRDAAHGRRGRRLDALLDRQPDQVADLVGQAVAARRRCAARSSAADEAVSSSSTSLRDLLEVRRGRLDEDRVGAVVPGDADLVCRRPRLAGPAARRPGRDQLAPRGPPPAFFSWIGLAPASFPSPAACRTRRSAATPASSAPAGPPTRIALKRGSGMNTRLGSVLSCDPPGPAPPEGAPASRPRCPARGRRAARSG